MIKTSSLMQNLWYTHFDIFDRARMSRSVFFNVVHKIAIYDDPASHKAVWSSN